MASHRLEDVVEVVCDPARELSDGFHLLGLEELFFELLSRRDVAPDTDDRDNLRCIVEDRGVRPTEPAPAVLCHGALFDIDRVGRREEIDHGAAGSLTVILVDMGHVLVAEEFLFSLAEDPAVRGTDKEEPAIQIHLDDQIGLVLHQQAIAAFASFEGFLVFQRGVDGPGKQNGEQNPDAEEDLVGEGSGRHQVLRVWCKNESPRIVGDVDSSVLSKRPWLSRIKPSVVVGDSVVLFDEGKAEP